MPSNSDLVVIGLCHPAGVAVDSLLTALRRALKRHQFETEDIRLSTYLKQRAGVSAGSAPIGGPSAAVPAPRRSEEYGFPRLDPEPIVLMNAGNDLCEKDPEALARYAIRKIHEGHRHKIPRKRGPCPRVAFLVSSLKRTQEVEAFRDVYGDRFVLLSVTAEEHHRRASLDKKLVLDNGDFTRAQRMYWVEEIIHRDANDQVVNGQRFQDVFSLGDFFLPVAPTRRPDGEVERFIDLLMGEPFITPTVREQSMYVAHAAGLRSSERSRQVGSAVVSDRGEILAVGCNEVPRPGGGQYWSGDLPDGRDFVRGWESNQKLKFELITEMAGALRPAGPDSSEGGGRTARDLAEDWLGDQGPLRHTAVNELIEFGRITHGEMAAICAAARNGIALTGSSLFCTTYPCHMCMRLVIDTGISRLVYIHPYPKSRVEEMFDSEAAHGFGRTDLVAIEAYSGVAPTLYPKLFDGTFRKRRVKRDSDGSLKPPSPEASFRLASPLRDQCIEHLEEVFLQTAPPGHRQWARSARHHP
jgi:cytidine deaminase